MTTKEGTHRVTGSIFGKGDSRITQLEEYSLEGLLSKNMLVLNNMDVPGVIGNLGNILGKHHLNIAGFHLGRMEDGRKAVAIINIDSPPTTEALRELRDTANIINVHSVSL